MRSAIKTELRRKFESAPTFRGRAKNGRGGEERQAASVGKEAYGRDADRCTDARRSGPAALLAVVLRSPSDGGQLPNTNLRSVGKHQ